MKRLFVFVLAAVAFVAAKAQDTAYTISGSVPDGVTKVYLRLADQRQVSDSATVKDGHFVMKGQLPFNAIMIVAAGEYGVPCFNDNTPILINFTERSVEASPLNMLLHTCDKQIDEYYPQLEALYMSLDSVGHSDKEADRAKTKQLMAEVEKLEEAMTNDMKGFVRTNHDNLIPAYYLSQIYYAYGYDELKAVLDPSAPYFNHPATARAKRQLGNLEKRKPGTMYTDLTMNGLDGGELKLSQWCGKGNYVLIDFWASWCGPCRREMPNVVENYAKYHAKGLEIVGISFDSKAEAWRNAVSKLGMTWPQMSDLKGWKCAAASVYGIASIPSNVLLDKEGRIIATDLTGDKLGDKLKEVYGF